MVASSDDGSDIQFELSIPTGKFLHDCHDLLSEASGPAGRGLPTEALLNRNVFLREPIFRYWQKEFRIRLEAISLGGSRADQTGRLAAVLLAEEEWRMFHKAMQDSGAAPRPDALRLLLNTTEWFNPEEAPSLHYAVDTRRWVNALSLNALHHIREEMLPFGLSMMQGLEQFKRLAYAVGTGRIALIEAEEEGRTGRRGIAKLRETEAFLAELRSALTGGTDPVPLSAEFFAKRGSRAPRPSDQAIAATPAA
jgi:hypothetical protein